MKMMKNYGEKVEEKEKKDKTKEGVRLKLKWILTNCNRGCRASGTRPRDW